MRTSEVDDFGASVQDLVGKRRKLYGLRDFADDVAETYAEVTLPFSDIRPALEVLKGVVGIVETAGGFVENPAAPAEGNTPTFGDAALS